MVYIYVFIYMYIQIYIYIYYIYIYIHIFIYVHLYDNFGTIIIKCNQTCTVTLASRYNHEICYTSRKSTNSDLIQIARWEIHFPTE